MPSESLPACTRYPDYPPVQRSAARGIVCCSQGPHLLLGRVMPRPDLRSLPFKMNLDPKDQTTRPVELTWPELHMILVYVLDAQGDHYTNRETLQQVHDAARRALIANNQKPGELINKLHLAASTFGAPIS